MADRASKLLIITQKMDENDIALSFFLEWISQFSEYFDRIEIWCLYKGQYTLPADIVVRSLGKKGSNVTSGLFDRLHYTFNLWRLSIKHRKEYDFVFVHMNPIWIVVGAPLWRLMGKRVSLWYAHGKVTLKLHIATWLTHIAFSSNAKGYRIDSPKRHLVGQGIDTNNFKPSKDTRYEIQDTKYKIISVGRITSSKDYATLIEAMHMLQEHNTPLPHVTIIGEPLIASDHVYQQDMQQLIDTYALSDHIAFIGPIKNKELPAYLQRADLFVNTGLTGSLDKTTLEAMATGLVMITCNEALEEVLGTYSTELMFTKRDPKSLVTVIQRIMNMSKTDRDALGRALREIVIRDHTTPALIKKMATILKHE